MLRSLHKKALTCRFVDIWPSTETIVKWIKQNLKVQNGGLSDNCHAAASWCFFGPQREVWVFKGSPWIWKEPNRLWSTRQYGSTPLKGSPSDLEWISLNIEQVKNTMWTFLMAWEDATEITNINYDQTTDSGLFLGTISRLQEHSIQVYGVQKLFRVWTTCLLMHNIPKVSKLKL